MGSTIIFKATNSPPAQAKFLTYDGLPTDWYLRLVGEGSKLIRGEQAGSVSDGPFPTSRKRDSSFNYNARMSFWFSSQRDISISPG